MSGNVSFYCCQATGISGTLNLFITDLRIFNGSLSNVGVTNNLSTSEGISVRRYSFHFIQDTIYGSLEEKNF